MQNFSAIRLPIRGPFQEKLWCCSLGVASPPPPSTVPARVNHLLSGSNRNWMSLTHLDQIPLRCSSLPMAMSPRIGGGGHLCCPRRPRQNTDLPFLHDEVSMQYNKARGA